MGAARYREGGIKDPLGIIGRDTVIATGAICINGVLCDLKGVGPGTIFGAI